MIITPKQPGNDKTHSRLSRLVPYMLRGKGEERCTWFLAGNLPGLRAIGDATELDRRRKDIQQRLARVTAERGLEITQERES
jgi:hypothetical protein